MAKIEVHGFHNSGAVYTVRSLRVGRRNRRRRVKETLVGVRGGRNIERAEWEHVVHGGAEHVIFNKGHEYDVLLTVEGLEVAAVVDAVEDYAVLEIKDGMTVEDVAAISPPLIEQLPVSPPVAPAAPVSAGNEGDDEDAPSKEREAGADEEE